MAEKNTSRRRKAARVRSEADNVVRESVPDIQNTGLLDLVQYGQIRIVVVNYQIKQIYIEPSFEPRIPTPELALT